MWQNKGKKKKTMLLTVDTLTEKTCSISKGIGYVYYIKS